jgi:hypothetical protein
MDDLNFFEKREISCDYRDSNPGSSSLVFSDSVATYMLGSGGKWKHLAIRAIRNNSVTFDPVGVASVGFGFPEEQQVNRITVPVIKNKTYQLFALLW